MEFVKGLFLITPGLDHSQRGAGCGVRPAFRSSHCSLEQGPQPLQAALTRPFDDGLGRAEAIGRLDTEQQAPAARNILRVDRKLSVLEADGKSLPGPSVVVAHLHRVGVALVEPFPALIPSEHECLAFRGADLHVLHDWRRGGRAYRIDHGAVDLELDQRGIGADGDDGVAERVPSVLVPLFREWLDRHAHFVERLAIRPSCPDRDWAAGIRGRERAARDGHHVRDPRRGLTCATSAMSVRLSETPCCSKPGGNRSSGRPAPPPGPSASSARRRVRIPVYVYELSHSVGQYVMTSCQSVPGSAVIGRPKAASPTSNPTKASSALASCPATNG